MNKHGRNQTPNLPMAYFRQSPVPVGSADEQCQNSLRVSAEFRKNENCHTDDDENKRQRPKRIGGHGPEKLSASPQLFSISRFFFRLRRSNLSSALRRRSVF